MPRMAFIMDRLFRRYGLHGQSTLPMVLGGVYVGGCAVPGVMACKGIPDEKSRLATILIIPMLNCLAKVPLYVLLINAYFAAHKSLAMFFISTIGLLMVLPVARILTLTVLKDRDTAPFVMEMPPYHRPTLRGVMGRATERVWVFVRKITTIVAALAVVVFVLLRFPSIDGERKAHYTAEKERAVAVFFQQIQGTSHADALAGEPVMDLIRYREAYRKAKAGVRGGEALSRLNWKFEIQHPLFYAATVPAGDPEARKVRRALKKLIKTRKKIVRNLRREQMDGSWLGRMGKALEPVT